jgi:hypothetical protein
MTQNSRVRGIVSETTFKFFIQFFRMQCALSSSLASVTGRLVEPGNLLGRSEPVSEYEVAPSLQN